MNISVFKIHNSNHKAISNQNIISVKKKIINNIKQIQQHNKSQQNIMKQKVQHVFDRQKQIIDNLISEQHKNINDTDKNENIINHDNSVINDIKPVSNDTVKDNSVINDIKPVSNDLVKHENDASQNNSVIYEIKPFSNDLVKVENQILGYDEYLIDKIKNVGKLIGKGKITIIH